ncbi:EG45-like domain containing protein [Tripterygium wilfordii]|uniref:EG45-like domain containing protein n=1 Tax=Tripterygium wilfordii TaxID=458696 RepID=A0A7J7DT19_TRIWF|nr:EG45-like domain containing protein [Tripterygium wilfordii]
MPALSNSLYVCIKAMELQRSVQLATYVLTLLMSSFRLFSLVSAVSGSGTATYEQYPYHFSGCHGFHDSDGDLRKMAKATEEIWDNGEVCGKKFIVLCIDGRDGDSSPCNHLNAYVTVKIMGYCENCKGAFVLTEEAYARIANTNFRRPIRVAYAE